MYFRTLSISAAILLLALTLGWTVFAGTTGNVEPPGPPDATSSYTLEDIYDRLDAGTAGTKSGFTEPASVPGSGTGHTLDDIMARAPAADNTDGAAPGDVLSGKTYWGLRTNSAWGLQTGTAVAGKNVAGPDGSKTFAIPDGFYSGKTATANDSDLAADNIKSGVDILGVVGTYPHAPVPRTWQTACYTITVDSETVCPATGYPGQDGDYQKGVAWPNPRFTANMDHNGDGDCQDAGETCDGTVTDNLTGLIWLANANCPGTDRDWSTALSDVAQLNTDGTMDSHDCGDISNGGSHQTDWRLPNIQELQSLAHYGVHEPAVPNTAGTGQWSEGDPFTGVLSDHYWSSTTLAINTTYAWRVTFRGGAVNGGLKTLANYVWPVRGGQ